MDSKKIAAVVIAIVIAGVVVGTGMYFQKDDNATSIEKVKDKVDVGDYIEYDSTEYYTGVSSSSIYSYLEGRYVKSDAEPTGESMIFKINDKDYVCTGYTYTDNAGSDAHVFAAESGFVVEATENYDGIAWTFTITETNMDISKDEKNQFNSIKTGTYYGGEIRNDYGDTEELTRTVLRYDSPFQVLIITEYSINADAETLTVTAVENDYVTVSDGMESKVITKTMFRGMISIDDMKKSMEELGYTFKVIDERKSIIDTPYGQRDVNIYIVDITDTDGVTSHCQLSCNRKGFIYDRLDFVAEEDGFICCIDSSLKSTSMLL